ncbi:MAG: hypothetical protein GX600_06235 [Dehalococcoidia bacterium]|nr:hypothetical protein [Dehalococcoidia bacterium]
MPLFESPKQRNKRIAGEVIHLTFERIRCGVPQPALQLAYRSVLTGAATLGLSLVQGDGLVKRLWGKGDSAKMLALVGIGSLPMVSMWFERSARQGESLSDAVRDSRQNAALNLLDMCGYDADRLSARASHMLTQFDYERLKEQGGEQGDARGLFLNYATLLLAMIQEAWLERGLLDWDSMEFPIRASGDILFRPPANMGTVLDLQNDGFLGNMMLCTTAIPNAAIAMFAMYDKFRSGAIS